MVAFVIAWSPVRMRTVVTCTARILPETRSRDERVGAAAEDAPVGRLLLYAAAAAAVGTTPLQDRASEVRYAIPAAIAYYADHGTWRGMTVAKLGRYYAVKGVVVRRATRTGFCLQTARTPFVH